MNGKKKRKSDGGNAERGEAERAKERKKSEEKKKSFGPARSIYFFHSLSLFRCSVSLSRLVRELFSVLSALPFSRTQRNASARACALLHALRPPTRPEIIEERGPKREAFLFRFDSSKKGTRCLLAASSASPRRILSPTAWRGSSTAGGPSGARRRGESGGE